MISRINLDTLRLAADGLSGSEIGRKLGIPEETVKSRLRACRDSLGALNTTHAVSIAHTTGLFGAPALDALPCPRCQGTGRPE
jgi:DNA-binding NarL/FixJ family response regulator